ncbi:attachment protein, partial [Pseudomonas aeruginosa]
MGDWMSNNARSGFGRILPLLGLLVSLLWHPLASAELYQWKITFGARPYAFFPSYAAACQSYFDTWSPEYRKTMNRVNDRWVQCIVHIGVNSYSTDAVLTGDSCPSEQELDPADGACKPPPEECKEGELFPAKGPDSPVVTSGGRNYVGDGGAPSACYQSCEYGGNPSPASCYLVKGSTTTGFCNYILKGTGQNCGADSYTFAQTGDSLNPPDTPNTDPSDPNDPGCPPGWSWSGTTCVKTPTDPTDPTDPTTPGGDGDGGGDGNGGGNNNGGGNDGGTGNGGDGSGGGDGNGGG